MNLEYLEKIQEKFAVQMVNELAMTCCQRFLRSAALLEIRNPVIDQLREVRFNKPFNLAPLMPAWRLLCKRYCDERYDPQMRLFEDRLSQLRDGWVQFVYWKLIPLLVWDDALARNVLRALGGLPCQSPESAADAVYQYFMEMTLPNAKPPWAAEEMTDQ